MSQIILNEAVVQNFFPQPIESDHYVFGDANLTPSVLMPNGHGWGDYLPLGETQSKNGIDPNSCPAGGTLNCVEAIGKRKFGTSFQNDLSERYLSIMSGMKGNGGDPHSIAEAMRRIAGAIPEAFLPFDEKIDTIKKYFSPSPMSYALFKVGAHWKQKYRFNHDWVFVNGTVQEKQQRIKAALKYSSVGVSGYAWSLHDDGKYYKDGPDIHWFDVFDFVEGEYWMAFDTYPPYVKKLDWNYDFGYAKRYSLERVLGGDDADSEPAGAHFEYFQYLAQWFISQFIQK